MMTPPLLGWPMNNDQHKKHDSLNHPFFLYMHATINMSATRANFDSICSGRGADVSTYEAQNEL